MTTEAITLSTDKYSRHIFVWCDRCQDYIVTTDKITLPDLLERIKRHECYPSVTDTP